MENNEKELEKDDIVNPEQFQVGRAPQEEKEDDTDYADDSDYTEQEIPFADGKGTELAEEFEEPEEESEDDEFVEEEAIEEDFDDDDDELLTEDDEIR